MIKNYVTFKKSLESAIMANYKVHEEVKEYDEKDVRYFFMEDPDFFTLFGNYKTLTEKILNKIK
jgi:hypothetical protein